MKFCKQVLLAFVVLFVSTTVLAACTNREKDDAASDLYEDIKCGLSTAKDTIKDGVSSVGSTIKDGSTKAFDAISKAASKTSSVLRDGLNVAVETSKTGYQLVRDVITGRKASEYRDGEGVIDFRFGNETEP